MKTRHRLQWFYASITILILTLGWKFPILGYLVLAAMIGGFIMGIAESLTKGFVSSQLSDAVVYGILIIVLLFKPSGLLGKAQREKV